MKTLHVLISSFVILGGFTLSSCAPAPEITPLALPQFEGIIGGKNSRASDLAAQHVALTHDMATGQYCSSVIVAPKILLTAAHCITEDASKLTIAFGVDPLAGKYILRRAVHVLKHDLAKIASKEKQIDLALIVLSEKIPAGYFAAIVPAAPFPLQEGLRFTAAGYGRTHGLADSENTGSGILRQVNLEIAEIRSETSRFTVDQTKGKGICNGDSGGPALMSLKGKTYVVGIASATSWIFPSEMSEGRRDEYLKTVDVCSYKSLYINLVQQENWVNSSILNLEQKLF